MTAFWNPTLKEVTNFAQSDMAIALFAFALMLATLIAFVIMAVIVYRGNNGLLPSLTLIGTACFPIVIGSVTGFLILWKVLDYAFIYRNIVEEEYTPLGIAVAMSCIAFGAVLSAAEWIVSLLVLRGRITKSI